MPSSKPLLFLLGLSASLALGGCKPPEKSRQTNPIGIEPPKVDVGLVAPGNQYSRQVTLTNQFQSETILIKKLAATCSCTRAHMAVTELEPGKAAKVDILFQPGYAPGEKTADVIIEWETRSGHFTGTETVPVSGSVRSLAEFEPPLCDFGLLQDQTTPQSRDIQVHQGYPATTWDDFEIQSRDPCLKATTSPKSGPTFTVHITLDPAGLPSGKYKGRLIFLARKGGVLTHEETFIPVQAQIASDIKIEPGTLYLGIIKKGAPNAAEVSLIYPRDKKFKFLSWEAENKSVFTAQPVVTSETGKTHFKFPISADCAPGSYAGDLTLSAEISSKLCKVNIPYIMLIQP